MSPGLREQLAIRGAPERWPPPPEVEPCEEQEGLRLYVVREHGCDCHPWQFLIVGPGNVLLAFNNFTTEQGAAFWGRLMLDSLAECTIL